MSYLKFTLALILLICAISSVRAWDLGVVTATRIHFYSNKTVETTTAVRLNEMEAVAFDPIKKDVYVSDANQKVGSIFRIKTTGDTAYSVIEPIVAKQAEIVEGMAFDYHTSILYWTTGKGKTINFVHVSENTTKDLLIGQVLLRFENEIPLGIAIDTCRGFLYWTNCNHTNPTIERSRLNGKDRKVIVRQNLFQPLGIAVDMKKNLLYWSDEREGMYYSIESSDLDGGSRKKLIHGMHHQPYAIALNDRDIYWSDWTSNAVWMMPKDSFEGGVSPITAANFSAMNTPMGLITPYGNATLVNDTHCEIYQIEDIDVPTTGATPMSIPYEVLRDICKNSGVLHVNGTCTCAPGFTGEYCQIGVCDGYCISGTCLVSSDGQPTCRCPTTSYGDRCEKEVCADRCLNGAQCKLDGTGYPRCECPVGYTGNACEFKVSALNDLCLVYCQHSSPMAKSQQSSICRCDQYDSRQYEYPEMSMLNHTSSCKVSRSLVAVIAILTVFVASLGTITIVLARKVRMLGRRPRIKKRIVVNKSITPLTCRPPQQQNQQCEITIENCCNMNICETPCFEPDFRSPKMVGGGLMSSLQSKSKKEDKANLLSSTDMSSEDEKPSY